MKRVSPKRAAAVIVSAALTVCLVLLTGCASEAAAPFEALKVTSTPNRQEYKNDAGIILVATELDTVEFSGGAPGVAEKIAAAYDLQYASKDSEVLEQYLQGAKEQLTYHDEDDLEYWFGNFTGRYVTAERSDDKVVSIVVHLVDNMADSAHGTYGDYPMNFNAATGEPLTLSDLAAEGADLRAKLLEYAGADLPAQTEIADGLYEDFASYLGTELDNGQWNLNADGILLTYNIYTIAPYAAGQIQVIVPYSALAGYIDESYMPAQ